MAKPWNVIWMLVDSVRNYRGAGDDRDKLEMMDRLSSEAVSFSTVVTSAPSTVMSVAAMMTSCPAYTIARDYDNFKYDPSAFTSLRDVLVCHGYENLAVLCYRSTRERFGNLLDQVPRTLWPAGLRHAKSPWSNDDINGVLANILKRGLNEPTFLYLHYNCRNDFQTSEKVEWALDQIRANGLLDRSVLVMCSDHGYPDPSRGVNKNWFKDHGLTHDLLVTDDNILIPLYIRYPGVEPKEIDTVVASLDITPTILDLLQISPPEEFLKKAKGQSLVPLIRGDTKGYESRRARVDSRFMMQTHRVTALRGDRYKLAVERDAGRRAFYDLQEDPKEDTNLINSPAHAAIVQDYEAELESQEQAALDDHLQVLIRRADETFDSRKVPEVSTALVIDLCSVQQRRMLSQVLANKFPGARMDLVTTDKAEGLRGEGYSQVWRPQAGALNEDGRLEIQRLVRNKSYDLVVVLTNAPTSFKHAKTMRWAAKFGRGAVCELDPNMDGGYKWQRPWTFPLTVLAARRQFYLSEPLLLAKDVLLAVWKRIKKRNPLAKLVAGKSTRP